MKKSHWNSIKIVLAAMSGHVLEFYDFTIYGVFAVELGKLFFPHSSPIAQTLSSLGVFAAGFLMRPVGGIIFGHIGDRYGRRFSLTISVVVMALITFMIGILPDYNSWGVMAPIILVVFRLLQGLCVGGEGVGSSIFVLEHLHNMKPGLVGGIVNGSLTMGIMLAVLVGLLLHTYFPSDPEAWRYAFILGGMFGIVGLYLRLSVDETPAFEKLKNENKIVDLPIKEVFQHNFNSVILTIAAGCLTSTSAYLLMTYLNVYFKTQMGATPVEALQYGLFANFLLMVLLPIMGAFSDKFGYTRTMVASSSLATILAIPIFYMLSINNDAIILLAIILLAMLAAGIYAPLYPFIMKLFTPEQRYSGIACSLNIGIATCGGLTSMTCLWLVNSTGYGAAAGIYWIVVCFGFIYTIAKIQKVSYWELVSDKMAKAIPVKI